MTVNINVKRTFRVNGKEYSSIEELPDDIREAVRNALASRTESERGADLATAARKIILNGKEYESIDAMPQDVRQVYETVLKAADTETASPAIDAAGISRAVQRGPGRTGVGHVPQPTAFESSFSLRKIIVSVALVALLLLLYYLWQGR